MVRILGRLNVNIGDIVLEKAPKIVKYTSPTIQKEILYIITNRVRRKICEKIENINFCYLVDEGRDESNRENMLIILLILLVVLQNGILSYIMLKAIGIARMVSSDEHDTRKSINRIGNLH